jgi:hypothetical protein
LADPAHLAQLPDVARHLSAGDDEVGRRTGFDAPEPVAPQRVGDPPRGGSYGFDRARAAGDQFLKFELEAVERGRPPTGAGTGRQHHAQLAQVGDDRQWG